MPETWTPDQIGQFQAYWDALLEGDTAQRRIIGFLGPLRPRHHLQEPNL